MNLSDKQISDQRNDLIAELTAFHGVSADLLETQRKQGSTYVHEC